MLLYAYLDFETTRKKHDISTLTKKRYTFNVHKSIYSDAISGGLTLEAGEYYITHPFLNGRLPNNLTVTKGSCNISILELAGVGDENYFKITKENDNGIPSYGS